MKKLVRVILKENVDKLGLKGEEKNLSKGYVKNFLLPQKRVVLATDLKAKKIIKELKNERVKLEKAIVNLKELAQKLSGEVVEITAKASESGKLFGSITSEDIAKKLKIDKTTLEMTPIKTIGEHHVEINLGYNILVKVKVKISPILSKSSKAKSPLK